MEKLGSALSLFLRRLAPNFGRGKECRERKRASRNGGNANGKIYRGDFW
ncbi:MAG: hypothetical protein HFK09_03605 [Clostridia bacterium]|nr:hypothetical protein [Clostridia bacterium]